MRRNLITSLCSILSVVALCVIATTGERSVAAGSAVTAATEGGTASTNRKGFMLASGNPTQVAQDVAFLGDQGATMVRLPLYIGGVSSMDYWFTMIDSALSVAQPRGMTVVIDFHWPSPGVQGSTITDPQDFTQRWASVAARYRNRPASAVWYDLCNEPNHPQWRSVALSAAQAIRANDTVHPIVFSPVGGHRIRGGIKHCRPLPGISNQILQLHFWDWFGDVQNPTVSERRRYPSGDDRTRADVVRKLERLKALEAEYGVPVYLGEVGIGARHRDAPRFLQHVTNTCDRLGIHCTVHAYNEARVWEYRRNPAAWDTLMAWLAK